MRAPLALALLSLLGCKAPEPPFRVDAHAEGSLATASATIGRGVASDDAFDRMEGHFPDTRLVSHRGEEVRFYEDLVRGRKVAIQFMYTSCEGT